MNNDDTEKQLKQKLQELKQMEKQLEERLEEVEKRERRQDVLRSIANSVGLDEEDFMATEQPSNKRFNKKGLKKVDNYIKELEQKVDELPESGEAKPKIEA